MRVYKKENIFYIKELAELYKDYLDRTVYENMKSFEKYFDLVFPEYSREGI